MSLFQDAFALKMSAWTLKFVALFCYLLECLKTLVQLCSFGRGHTVLTSRELMWCYACSWDVRGDLTLNSIELFHQPILMHNSLYSLTICLLHYYPRHVSSISMPIFRRKNCIHTASGNFALCKRLHSTQCTVQTFTESEDTRCCVNTIFPPEDGHVNAWNMSRIIV